jgi:ATP-dependent DNA ligase
MPIVDSDDSLGFNQRQQALGKIFDSYYEQFLNETPEEIFTWKPQLDARINIVEVETFIIENLNDVNYILEKFVAEGFEGAILRGINSQYLWGYRSDELLKVKTFQDAEFEIVDIIEV